MQKKKQQSSKNIPETLLKNSAQYEKLLQTCMTTAARQVHAAPDAAVDSKIASAVKTAQNHLLQHKKQDTYWDGKIEDTPGLTAQYILYMHYMDMLDLEKQQKCVNYLLRIQNQNGSWRIYHGDNGNLSYTIHCYFALKVAGIDKDHPQMVKAREYILANGGLEKGNVETRFLLALFGKTSWKRAVPIPLGIVMLGKWFPFSMWNMAYWIRVTLVSMGILNYLKPVRNPGSYCDVEELWINHKLKKKYTCPKQIKFWSLENFFFFCTRVIRQFMKITPKKRRIKKALNWVLAHQDDSGDWGGIYPPMMYGSFMLKEMGFQNDHPVIIKAKEAIERFHWVTEDEIMQMSCVSPIWDTAWAMLALTRAGMSVDDKTIQKAKEWLYSKQIWREGDWIVHAPDAKPGMWAFQLYNDFYPDTDDTAVVLMALLETLKDGKPEEMKGFKAGCDWLFHMQNPDGGWAAFERKIDKKILLRIPLNDLDNYIDPSTPELTGRILELFGRLGFTTETPFIQKAVDSLKMQQEPHGSWHGKWGVHYIYGAFGVLRGLGAIGYNMKEDWVQKCVHWIKDIQNADGGWGESCNAYNGPKFYGKGNSAASQTGWAILSLLAAGEKDSPAVKKGIEWLLKTQQENGEWLEEEFTGTGFPRAFYLRYDLYRLYFPLLALAEYADYENQIWAKNPYNC